MSADLNLRKSAKSAVASLRFRNQQLRGERPAAGPTALGDILPAVLREHGFDRRASARTLRLFDAFNLAVAEISAVAARRCRPVGYRSQRLYADCDSAVLLSELRTFRGPALLKRVAELAPETVVTAIVWRNRSRN